MDRRSRLGLPLIAVIGLALLAAPRVVLHDLGLIESGSAVNAVLTFVPPLIWIAVAVIRQIRRPLLTLVLIGLCYGVILLLAHQLLWNINTAGQPPQLGGNLSDLSPVAQAIIMRTFAGISSLVTGTVVGLISGLAAWLLTKLLRRR